MLASLKVFQTDNICKLFKILIGDGCTQKQYIINNKNLIVIRLLDTNIEFTKNINYMETILLADWAHTLPDNTPPIDKIYPFSKIAKIVEPILLSIGLIRSAFQVV